MSAIIKRKLRETWRDAVAARLREGVPDKAAGALAAFDAAVDGGAGEAEAAYATLSAHGLLWRVENAGFTPPPDQDPPQTRHSVPSV